MAMPRWFGYQFRQWINDRYLEDNNRDLDEVRVVVFDDDRNDIAAIPASKIGSGSEGASIAEADKVALENRIAAVETQNDSQDVSIEANRIKNTQQDTALGTKADQSAMTTALGTKADQSAMTTALAAKADQSAMTTALAAKADQSAVDLKADQSEVDQIVDGADLSSSTVSMNAFDTRLDALEAGGGGTTPELTNLTTTVQGIRSDLGNPNDAASATGSAFARIKQNVSTIAARVTTATLNALNIGSSSDAPNVTGSLWARVLRNRNSVNNAHDLIGESSDPASSSGSLFARVKQNASDISDRVLTSVFTTLQNRVGAPPSVNFRYYSNETTSSISSGSASGQTIWNWLARYSVSIVNLRNRLGVKLDTTTFTNARVGEPDDTADSATTASLWAQFKQALVTLGNKLNTSTWTAARVGTPADTASSADSATSWAQLKQVKLDVTSATGGGTVDSDARTRLDALEGNVGTPSDYTGNGNINGSVFARLRWLYQAVTARVTTATFNTLSGLVGGRPSTTYYYLLNAADSLLSSANANTQSVWVWLTRFSTSIKSLADKFTAVRIGLPADTASSATTASLWAQFKNALAVINNILGGQTGHTAVNVEHINFRTIDQRLGNTSTPSAEDSTKAWGRIRWLGTTLTALSDLVGAIGDAANITSTKLWAQFNQVKAWLGSPSGNLSYYADQNTSSISAAGANSQDVWTWLTRFSFSIRNLKNRKLDISTWTAARVGAPDDPADSATTASLWAQFKQSLTNTGGGGGVSQAAFQALAEAVGAVSDAANIAGTTLWNRMNQVTEWVGLRGTAQIITNISSTFSVSTGYLSVVSMWGWLHRILNTNSGMIKRLLDAVISLQAQVGGGGGGVIVSSRPPQYTEKIDIQDKDTTLPNENGVEIPLSNLGYQENDLVRNPTPKLFRVRGSHLPLDHPMRVTSTDTDIAISSAYHLYGWAKAVIPELTNATSGTIAEVDNAATQDIGDQLVAVLNMSSLSTIDGKFIIVMSRPSASNDGFVPDELTIKIGSSPMRVFANVDEYHRTDTHIFYQTSQAFESGLGVNPLFGDSQVGQAVNFDVGIKNAEGNNFLLSAATTLYLQEILIDRVSTGGFGKLADIPRAEDKALGSRYDTEEGETYVVKEKAGRERFIIPIPIGDGRYGYSNKTDGAISGRTLFLDIGGSGGLVKDVWELSYDYTNEYWRVALRQGMIKNATQLKVWKDGWGDVKGADADIMKLIVPPESITHGAKLKLAGTIIPRSNAAKITAANFGANLTRNGNSVNRFVGVDGSNGTFPANANLEGWFFDRQEDWLEADVERSNHTQMRNWIVGQKLTPQVTSQVVHYREQQTNEGNLGSRNANHQIGLYEMKLSFGSTDRDETYLHLPIANADVSSSQKLVMFLHRKNASNSNPDFIDMEHRDGFMFDLEYSRAISDVAYPRYKWRIAANQNLGASLSALAGDWYVGVAIMGTQIAAGVHALVESWIPKAYTKLYFEGVQLPVENLVISRNSDDDFIFSYRSGQYSQAQRDLYYASGTAENQKDIMVSGQQYVINLINADGGTHIRMLANMAQHIKEFDHFKVDVLNSANASILTDTPTQKFWQRLPKADAGEIVHRGLNSKAPAPHHLNQRAIFTTGQGGSFRPYESVSMYNRFDPAPYFRVVLPLTAPSNDSVWSVTPEMWRDNAPNLAGILGQWAGSLMRIDIPSVANSRVLLYVLTDGSTSQDAEMDYLDMRGREWDDITLDPVADFRRRTAKLVHDEANNRSYFCHVIDHSSFNAVNMFADDATFYSFILGVWTIASNVLTDRSDVKPRKTLEYVHVR